MVGRLDAVIGPIKHRRRGHTGGQLLVGIAAAQLAGEDFLVGLDRQRADTAGQQLAPVWSRGQQRWSTRGVVAISMFPSWSRIRRVSGDGRDQAHPRPTEPQEGSRALGHLAVPLSRDRMKPDASPVTRATISAYHRGVLAPLHYQGRC